MFDITTLSFSAETYEGNAALREAEFTVNGIDYRLVEGAEYRDGEADVELALINGRTAADTANPQHWPVFDRIFGRAQWKEFVAARAAEVAAEYATADDDE